MSMVTNVLVLVPGHTPVPIRERLEEGYEDGRGMTVCFRDLAEYHGSDEERNPARFWPGKVPHSGVWASAVNHLDRDKLGRWLREVFAGRSLDLILIAVLGESNGVDEDCWHFTTLSEGDL